MSIGQYIWKPENESQWHGSGDSARITLEISADGIAIAKVTNPGDFRAGTDHGRINKVGTHSPSDKQGWNCFRFITSVNFAKRLFAYPDVPSSPRYTCAVILRCHLCEV